MAKKTEATVIVSPPFRDSDAMYIIAKRMDALADKMTRHDYSTVEADLAEVTEWMTWLARGITERAAKGDAEGGDQ